MTAIMDVVWKAWCMAEKGYLNLIQKLYAGKLCQKNMVLRSLERKF